MALCHKWDVKNDFAYVLQFFSLISDGLGSVNKERQLMDALMDRTIAPKYTKIHSFFQKWNMLQIGLVLKICSLLKKIVFPIQN